jgi:MFS transporter, Spinster family, sphingosine-1-phosphate transporter
MRVAGASHPAVVVGVTFLLTSIAMIDRGIVAVLMPAMKEDLRLSDGALGLLSGLPFAVTLALVAIPIGWLADTRFSRTKTVAVSMAVWSAMTSLCGAATGLVSLFLLRMGVGAGEGGGAATALSVVMDSTPPAWKRRAVMVCNWGSIAGQALALAGGAWLVTHYGWRATFAIVGAPGIILALIYYVCVQDPPRSSPVSQSDSPLKAFKLLLASRPYVLFLLATGFQASVLHTLITWMPTWLVRSSDMTMKQAGGILGAIMLISGILGPFVYGWAGDLLAKRDRRWPIWLCAGTIVIVAVLLPGVFLSGDLRVGQALFAAAVFLMVGLAPLMAVGSQELAPAYKTTAIAGLTVSTSVFASLLTWGVGIVSDSVGANAGAEASAIALRTGLLATIPAALFAGLFYWLSAKSLDREQN